MSGRSRSNGRARTASGCARGRSRRGRTRAGILAGRGVRWRRPCSPSPTRLRQAIATQDIGLRRDASTIQLDIGYRGSVPASDDRGDTAGDAGAVPDHLAPIGF
jgi:hypothetical protein